MAWSARAADARRALGAISLVALALQLSACRGGQHPRTGRLPPAAEPAAAPATTPLHPSGHETRVGTLPEGIVIDPHAGMVAVAVRGPAALVLIDARSGRVLRRMRIAAPPRHLELAAENGPVLVPAEPIDQLIEVSLPSRTVLSIPVGVHPHDAASAAGRLFVGNEFGRSVSVVVGRRVVAAIGGFLQPGGLASVKGDVAVVDVRADTVTLVDAHTLQVLGSARAGQGPTHVVAGSGRLYVVDTRGNALLAYATEPKLRPVGRLPLPGTPYGIAIDPVRNRLWVTLTATNQLVEVGIAGPTLRRVASYPTGRQPNTVAVDPRDGRVFVADAGPGLVQMIDP